ncbi:TIGR01457 family HAD-type hydrolase [Limosilactobacillus sp.]|uniref:TIGR01457 family HAD-type hydrolase n=1 Tax=Limosilactobacillus sp. TaxID=2773925 RepID=UPI00345E63E7
MKDYQAYFVDLDGTIYRGKQRIPAAGRFVKRLRKAGKRLIFVTNNSTRTPEDVVKKLRDQHGIDASPNDVYTSAIAAADYLKNQLASDNQRKVYAIGENGLKMALQDQGFILTDKNPDFVTVGLDFDVTYHKFEIATLAIRNGAKFIGTNGDTNLPSERGMIPSAGSLVKLVEYATQTKPIMIGKPHRLIMEMALQRYGLQKDQVLMVGDNYHTDIMAGINEDMDTLLVFTGLTRPEELKDFNVQPTYTVNSLDEWRF